MNDVGKPRYIDRWEQAGSHQPYVARNANMYGFVFPGNREALQTLCDRYLNLDPTGAIAFAPLISDVLLTFTSLHWVAAQRPPFRNDGGVQELELAIFVAVQRRWSSDVFLFNPYIFVDNPMAMVEGREIYGFPKEFGAFDASKWPAQFGVDAFGFERFSPRSVAKRCPLLTVRRTVERRGASLWRNFDSAAEALLNETLKMPSLDRMARAALAKLPGGLWPPQGPLIFLKQFADVADSEYACYQALNEARIKVGKFDSGQLLTDDYTLELENLASHPLTRDLGLRHGSAASLKYSLKFDFRLLAGREIWRAADGTAARLSARRSAALPCGLFGEPGRTLWNDLWDSVSAAWRATNGIFSPATSPSNGRSPATATAPHAGKRGEKKKIAILGGGVGAVSAAFALTDTPDWKDRYDITIYQLGWRLGGKGASGRNRAIAQRIEEHGLHVWFGFYYNALPMMQKCYQELDRLTGRQGSWEAAFQSHDYVVLEEHVNDEWIHWAMSFPPLPGGTQFTPWGYVREVLRWMLTTFHRPHLHPYVSSSPSEGIHGAAWWHSIADDLTQMGVDCIAHASRFLHCAVDFADQLAHDPAQHAPKHHEHLITLMQHYQQWVLSVAAEAADDTVRRAQLALDLGAAFVRGMLADSVVAKGFDHIDRYDLRDWFRRHGATPASLDSAWIRALYSLPFAFEDGDSTRPSVAAGTMLRGTLRMLLGYHGAFMRKMNAGMGDIVFAPFYQVLKARGVTFKFFHRVRALRLTRDRKSIGRIELGCQAHVKDGAEYAPLQAINGRMCWPDEPDYVQLEEGDAIKALKDDPQAYVNLESWWSSWGPAHETDVTLEKGTDFDIVVLGISLGALPYLCGDLIAANPKWKRMVQRVKTVRTQSFQLWIKRSLTQLGWTLQSPIAGAYAEPIDTWADMSHTLAAECWPRNRRPKFTTYLCGPMPESGPEPPHFTSPQFPKEQHAEVEREMQSFLRQRVGSLWPKFRPADVLSSFCVANIDPTERYVQSLPGTTQYRLPSDHSEFANLFLAGDWTRNGFNAGSVESAVISGMQVSRKISGTPHTILGESDFPK